MCAAREAGHILASEAAASLAAHKKVSPVADVHVFTYSETAKSLVFALLERPCNFLNGAKRLSGLASSSKEEADILANAEQIAIYVPCFPASLEAGHKIVFKLFIWDSSAS